MTVLCVADIKAQRTNIQKKKIRRPHNIIIYIAIQTFEWKVDSNC